MAVAGSRRAPGDLALREAFRAGPLPDDQELEAGMMRRIDAIMRGAPPSPAIAERTASSAGRPRDHSSEDLVDSDGSGAAGVVGAGSTRRWIVLSGLATAAVAVAAVSSLDLLPSRPAAPHATVVQPLPPVVAPTPAAAPAPVVVEAPPRAARPRVRAAAGVRRRPVPRRMIAARPTAHARPATAAAQRSVDGPQEIQTRNLTGEARRRALADDSVLTSRLNRQSLARGGLLDEPERPTEGSRGRSGR